MSGTRSVFYLLFALILIGAGCSKKNSNKDNVANQSASDQQTDDQQTNKDEDPGSGEKGNNNESTNTKKSSAGSSDGSAKTAMVKKPIPPAKFDAVEAYLKIMDSGTDDAVRNDWPFVQFRTISDDESKLLQDIRERPLEHRMDVLQKLLELDETSQNKLPIEFLVHASVGSDATSRSSAIELLRRKLESTAAIRMGMELNAFEEIPGLATKAVGLVMNKRFLDAWNLYNDSKDYSAETKEQALEALSKMDLPAEFIKAYPYWQRVWDRIILETPVIEKRQVTELIVKSLMTQYRSQNFRVEVQPSQALTNALSDFDDVWLGENLESIGKLFLLGCIDAHKDLFMKLRKLDPEHKTVNFEITARKMSRRDIIWSKVVRQSLIKNPKFDSQISRLKTAVANLDKSTGPIAGKIKVPPVQVVQALTNEEKTKLIQRLIDDHVATKSYTTPIWTRQSLLNLASEITADQAKVLMTDCLPMLGVGKPRNPASRPDKSYPSVAAVVGKMGPKASAAVIDTIYEKTRKPELIIRGAMFADLITLASENLDAETATSLMGKLEGYLVADDWNYLAASINCSNLLGKSEQQKVISLAQARLASEKMLLNVAALSSIASEIARSKSSDENSLSEIADQFYDLVDESFAATGADTTKLGKDIDGARDGLKVLLQKLSPEKRTALVNRTLKLFQSSRRLGRAKTPLATLAADLSVGLKGKVVFDLFADVAKSSNSTAKLTILHSNRNESPELLKVLAQTLLNQDPLSKFTIGGSTKEFVEQMNSNESTEMFAFLLDHLTKAKVIKGENVVELFRLTAAKTEKESQADFGRRVLPMLDKPSPFNSDSMLVECLAEMPHSLSDEQIEKVVRQQIDRLINPPATPDFATSQRYINVKRTEPLSALIKRLPADRRLASIDYLANTMQKEPPKDLGRSDKMTMIEDILRLLLELPPVPISEKAYAIALSEFSKSEMNGMAFNDRFKAISRLVPTKPLAAGFTEKLNLKRQKPRIDSIVKYYLESEGKSEQDLLLLVDNNKVAEPFTSAIRVGDQRTSALEATGEQLLKENRSSGHPFTHWQIGNNK